MYISWNYFQWDYVTNLYQHHLLYCLSPGALNFFFVGRDVRGGSPKWPGAFVFRGGHHPRKTSCKSTVGANRLAGPIMSWTDPRGAVKYEVDTGVRPALQQAGAFGESTGSKNEGSLGESMIFGIQWEKNTKICGVIGWEPKVFSILDCKITKVKYSIFSNAIFSNHGALSDRLNEKRAHATVKYMGSMGDSDAEKGGLLSLTYASPPEWDCPPGNWPLFFRQWQSYLYLAKNENARSGVLRLPHAHLLSA